ncbi:MAG: DUF427 domain-containing protein [Candidatus Kapaibacterium sp.]
MKAIWNGAVLAESDSTVEVENNQYFPPDTINEEYFEKSEKTYQCEWKGKARYYHIVVDGERNENAAWTYPDPTPEAQHIAKYFAFWNGVEVKE